MQVLLSLLGALTAQQHLQQGCGMLSFCPEQEEALLSVSSVIVQLGNLRGPFQLKLFCNSMNEGLPT